MNDRTGKVLRTIGIIFFGLAVIMNLLGGIGTSCVAFLTEDYLTFSALINEGKQWLYQVLVVMTVAIALAGLWILFEMIKGRRKSFRNALIVLIIGTFLAGVQYFASLQLFGKAAPANIKFYCNLFALIIFLFFLIPGVRERVNYTRGNSGNANKAAGGLAAIMIGIFLLTTSFWAGPSHTHHGINWVHLLRTELMLSGMISIGVGAALLSRVITNVIGREEILIKLKIPHFC